MSIGHMPRRYQLAWGVLWFTSVATAVGLAVTHPFETALSPLPEVLTGSIALTLAHAIWRAVTDDTAPQTAEQTRLTDYAERGN